MGSRRALTLLEVVFASFIFSALVTALCGIWVMHAKAQRQTGQLIVAADLADQEMDLALAQGFNDVADTSASFSQTWQVKGQAITYHFQSQTTVAVIEENGNPRPLKLITITVSYPEGSESKNYVLRSMIGDLNTTGSTP